MLTVKKIESTKPTDKPFKLSDSGGLYLYIAPSGGRSWRYDYSFNGKRKTITIGKYPFISLAEAREERDRAKNILAHGKDPILERKNTVLLADIEKANTFKSIAEEWYQSKKASWSVSYAKDVNTVLDRDIIPYIGNDPIGEIKPIAMLTVLKAIESRGAYEVARKARIRCSEIFKYAIVTGRAELNPVSDLSIAMISPQSKNYPFLAVESDMRDFMKALRSYSGNMLTRYATELLIYTVPRTIELITMEWSNVDFEERLVTISADVVKKDRIHLLPLSRQAIDILKYLKPITGNGKYVFPNRTNKNRPMSNGAILRVIARLGFVNRASGHGFRHQFSTVLNEKGFNRDWIEKQLNHEEGNVRGIYNHAQYLDGRREMMQFYADYIDSLAS